MTISDPAVTYDGPYDEAATPPKRIKEIIGRGFPLSKDTIQSLIQQADDLAHGRHPEPLDD